MILKCNWNVGTCTFMRMIKHWGGSRRKGTKMSEGTGEVIYSEKLKLVRFIKKTWDGLIVVHLDRSSHYTGHQRAVFREGRVPWVWTEARQFWLEMKNTSLILRVRAATGNNVLSLHQVFIPGNASIPKTRSSQIQNTLPLFLPNPPLTGMPASPPNLGGF